MSSPTFSSSFLLYVLIRSANIQNANNQCYYYIVLKIDNVKSKTNIVQGQQPKWEEEFYFDIPNRCQRLHIELWEHCQSWDKLLGLCQLNFDIYEDIEKNSKENERWIYLDSGIISTNRRHSFKQSNLIKHSLLIRTYVELPFDLNAEESEELRKQLVVFDQKRQLFEDLIYDEINFFSPMHLQQQFLDDYQQLNYHSDQHNDSNYTSDISNSKHFQTNKSKRTHSMLQSNLKKLINQNEISSQSKQKPLALVQPVVRDYHSIAKINKTNPMEKSFSLTKQDSFSQINSSKQFSINKLTYHNQM